ncbi:MAG: hypothetical protein AUK47_08960 [Deltaproteobacteria bacterium CG2_30_63_29]|nr:MAG: hypothetical protein AUK47_08960 [Deltaproteobacteria bacterium CG2_30_63_29]PJB48519.1 MAG: hypothetical protein CO108_02225 [Deltaproteobacteria bacterium CG_4_9_14_3_um_filter_63_12]
MPHSKTGTDTDSSGFAERPKTMPELPPLTRDTQPELPCIERRRTQVEIKPVPPANGLHCVPGPEDE